MLLARKLVLPLCLKVKPSASSFPLSRPADGGKRAPEAGRAEASQLWPQTRRREAARGVAPLVRTLCRCASRQEATKHSGPQWKVLNWPLCSWAGEPGCTLHRPLCTFCRLLERSQRQRRREPSAPSSVVEVPSARLSKTYGTIAQLWGRQGGSHT